MRTQNHERKAEEEKSLSNLKGSFLKYLYHCDNDKCPEEFKTEDETVNIEESSKIQNVAVVPETVWTRLASASVSHEVIDVELNRKEEMLETFTVNLPKHDINYGDPAT